MNRLQEQPFAALARELPTNSRCEAGKISVDNEEALSLFGPLHYEPNYAYPLIVWLHGSGESERQLRKIMPLVSLRNYVAVAPRATLALSLSDDAPASMGATKHCWVQTPEQIGRAQQRVSSAIATAMNRYNICSDRIFLAGYESGGTMALRIATESAAQFAGAISLGGPFPDQGTPLAKLHSARRLSLFIAASREGKHYPTEKVCDDLRLLHTAGMSLTLREYPGGDGLSPLMLADVDRWIMEQISQTAPIVGNADTRQTGVN